MNTLQIILILLVIAILANAYAIAKNRSTAHRIEKLYGRRRR